MREIDRKSTRLNSSHLVISYAVFCLKKKTSDGRVPHHPRTAGLYPLRRPRARRASVSTDGENVRSGGSAPAGSAYINCFFFFNNTATPEIYPLPLHGALPI